MQKKCVIFFSAVIIFTHSFLGIVKGSKNIDSCNIKLYSYYTNLAEIAIIGSEYSKAISYYDSAFFYNGFPFFKDRYNSLVCNALTGNFKKCRKELIYLLEKGLNIELIKVNEAFSTFLQSSYGKEMLDLKISATYNIVLRKKYDSILYADQYFRKIRPYDYHDYYNDTILKIDASNVMLMNNLIAEYGWPTLELVGSYDFNIHPIEIIIIHQGNKKNQIYNYSEDLQNACERCLIEPNRAQYLIARSNNSDKLNITSSGLTTIVLDSLNSSNAENYLLFEHKTGFFKIPEEKLRIINEERIACGLETIEDLQRKVLFSMKDKRFYFRFWGGMQFFTTSNMDDFIHLTRNLVEVATN